MIPIGRSRFLTRASCDPKEGKVNDLTCGVSI